MGPNARWLIGLTMLGCTNRFGDGQPPPPADAGACDPPAFNAPDCFSPGSGVTRCPEPDGSYWDTQADGTGVVHWRYNNAGAVFIICDLPWGK